VVDLNPTTRGGKKRYNDGGTRAISFWGWVGNHAKKRKGEQGLKGQILNEVLMSANLFDAKRLEENGQARRTVLKEAAAQTGESDVPWQRV